MRALPFAFRKAPSGGGGAAWYDTFDPASATGQTTVSYNGQLFGCVIVAGATGMCSKIRYRAGDVSYSASTLALMTTSGTILGSGAGTPAVAESWVEADVTPFAVTLGTSYAFMYCSENAAGIRARSKSGSGYQNYDQSYSSFPTGTVSLVDTVDQLCAGMYIG